MTLTTEQRERIARELGFEKHSRHSWWRVMCNHEIKMIINTPDEVKSDPRLFGPLVQAITELGHGLHIAGGTNTSALYKDNGPFPTLINDHDSLESLQAALCLALLEVMPDE